MKYKEERAAAPKRRLSDGIPLKWREIGCQAFRNHHMLLVFSNTTKYNHPCKFSLGTVKLELEACFRWSLMDFTAPGTLLTAKPVHKAPTGFTMSLKHFSSTPNIPACASSSLGLYNLRLITDSIPYYCTERDPSSHVGAYLLRESTFCDVDA